MSEVIKILIACFIQITSCTYVTYNLLDNRKFNVKFKNILTIIIMIILTFIFSIYDIGILKTIVLYLILILGYKFIFRITLNESTIINFFNIFLHFISETILGLLVIIFGFNSDFIEKYLQHTSLATLIVFIIIIFLTTLLKKSLKKMKCIFMEEKVTNIFYFIIISTIILILFLNININITTWQNRNIFIIGIMISITFILVLIFLFKEKIEKHKINKISEKNYEQSQKFSTMLQTHRKINHENINDLLVIKSMIKENDHATDYINMLLNDKTNNKYKKWIYEISKIPDNIISGFLEMKINDLISNEINVILFVSKNVKNFNFKQFDTKNYKDLFKIIGVYVDNALDACIETEEKEISIEIFFKKEELTIIISNTFINEINLDKISDCGYSTKGDNHGFGLSIVEDVLNSNQSFKHTSKIIKNYFYQYLYFNPSVNSKKL